jgi:SOS-response transcriptional repressor LexA
MEILGGKTSAKKELSQKAENLFAAIENYYSQTNQALNISQLSQITAITSKRAMQELIDEIEEAGKIRTYKLAERGRPRVIELFRPEVD